MKVNFIVVLLSLIAVVVANGKWEKMVASDIPGRSCMRIAGGKTMLLTCNHAKFHAKPGYNGFLFKIEGCGHGLHIAFTGFRETLLTPAYAGNVRVDANGIVRGSDTYYHAEIPGFGPDQDGNFEIEVSFDRPEDRFTWCDVFLVEGFAVFYHPNPASLSGPDLYLVIAAAVVAFVVILIVVGIFLYRKCKKDQVQTEHQPDNKGDKDKAQSDAKPLEPVRKNPTSPAAKPRSKNSRPSSVSRTNTATGNEPAETTPKKDVPVDDEIVVAEPKAKRQKTRTRESNPRL